VKYKNQILALWGD